MSIALRGIRSSVVAAQLSTSRAPPLRWGMQPQRRSFFGNMFGGGNKGGKGGKDSAAIDAEILESQKGTSKTSKAGGVAVEAEAAAEDASEAGALVQRGGEAPSFPSVVAVPLRGRPLFPGGMVPVTIQDPKLAEAIVGLKSRSQPYVGTFLRASGETLASVRDDSESESEGSTSSEDGNTSKDGSRLASGNAADAIRSLDDIHEIGTLASIHTIIPGIDGSIQVLLTGHRRLKATDIHSEDPVFAVKVENIRNPKVEESEVVKAYKLEIVSTLKDLLQSNPMFREQIEMFQTLEGLQDPAKLTDFVASVIRAEQHELQDVLETIDVVERMTKVLTLLKKELRVSKLQQEIQNQVNEKMSKQQREFLLREQLKAIKKELGMERDDKETVISEFRNRIKDLEVPAEVNKVIEEEIKKLSTIDGQSAEFNVTKSYLDWLTALPWGVYSEETFDVARAEEILNRDHYGLDDVKERILEFVAVGKLRGGVQGKILCLVGPPGVGKTSIGRSIADALGREYYRFSVGGLSDVAEIKGHRRTYVGAMPGKLMQCLKTTGTQNPMVLIDEIDKLGRGHQGDPASALLELLDPSQNGTFRDHYMDVPVDLSKVLFVCTANTLDTIPGPLLDRMEVTQIAGYVAEEKTAITRQYLEPRIQREAGIETGQVTLNDDALAALIESYCREAGVRNLNKKIEKIYRKAALKIVRNPDDQINISADDLHDYVGNAPFSAEKFYENAPAGITMGLAWTSMGGSALYIESSLADQLDLEKGRASIQVTGKLGDVMKESAQIAHTFAKRFAIEQGLEDARDFLHHAPIHLHVPEGATPKDGPSAGITLTTSLMSLAMGTPVRDNVAMTGEITLTGKVLPIGGVKEKTLAARRSGVKHIIFPKANEKDFVDLPSSLKEGIDAYFVASYEDVFRVCFPEVAATAVQRARANGA